MRRVCRTLLPLIGLLLLAACGGRASAPAAGATAALPLAATEPASTPAPPAEPTVQQTVAPARSAAPGELYVDAAAFQGTVSPLASGVTWGPLWFVRPDVMPLAEALDIGMISFPGGEYGDQRDLQAMEIDQFIDLSRRLGAEPLIHVRLPGGTPEKAAAMVEYANKTEGYGVKYWAIGNEPNLYAPRYTDEPWTPDYFAAEWRRFAEAMKAADPSIVLVGPEVTQFAGTEGVTASDQVAAAEWMRVFLEANGDLVDIISIHRYPFPLQVTPPIRTTVDQLRQNPQEWDRIIPDLRALMRETVGRELPIAVTEISSHYTKAFRQEATPDSLLNAVWWGDVLMRLLRQGVEIVTYWTLVTGDDQGGWGILSKYDARPTYHTFALYDRLGGDLVYAEAGAGEVGALAARRADGALTLMVTNMGLVTQTLTLAIEGAGAVVGAATEIWRVDADHLGTMVEGETVLPGQPVTLPPLSLTLYVFESR